VKGYIILRFNQSLLIPLYNFIKIQDKLNCVEFKALRFEMFPPLISILLILNKVAIFYIFNPFLNSNKQLEEILSAYFILS
jgi:hypothetical protein